MNLHIRAVEAAPPLTSVARYVLGMPHLCANGLSENWLWKELGHRHWGLIAEAFGRGASGFGPSDEPPIYAAFRNIALRDGDLASVGENDALDVRSTVTHLSGSRVVSRHVAVCQDLTVADVEMTSVFVRRRAEGKNRSVARVRVDARRRFAAFDGNPLPLAANGGNTSQGDDPAGDERDVGVMIVEPCPHLDFNGAGLLYFSSFIAAVDRAEWRLLGKRPRLYATLERRAVFHANIEAGEDLTVRVLVSREGAIRRHRALLHAASDGKLLAEVMTHRVA